MNEGVVGAFTVLVVDDDPAITEFLALVLEDQGYQVLCAIDGAALQMAHDRRPDVILLDVQMPGIGGVEISRRLRADPVTAHIPIIAMSAHDGLRSMFPALQADDQLPKPFAIAHLHRTVARWTTAS